jgi:histidinol-phosphatase
MEPVGWLRFLEEIADQADAIALRHFRSASLDVSAKADLSPVTEADLAIEERARLLSRENHPHLGVLGEEHGEIARIGETRLIIDPIDATYNFMRGIPVFATLLAIEREGEIIAGLVSAPAMGERWRAARGHGAYRGVRRLRVSRISHPADSQLFHGSLHGAEASPSSEGVLRLSRTTRRQRGFGDFWQHCLVAEGAGEIAVDPVANPWDAAALQILVEEAGGRATTLEGERTIYGGSLVSSNGHLHAHALELLRTPPSPNRPD